MMKFGHITKKDERTGMVTVRFERPEACGKCGACGSGSHQGEVVLPSDQNVGVWVRVELPENRFLQATALVYIIPLIGLLAGLFLGWLLGNNSDLITILSAAAGLFVSLAILFLIDKRVSKRPEWLPKITAVYPDNPTLNDLHCKVQ